MPPTLLLVLLLLITGGAVVTDRIIRRRQQAVFRALALEHHMHYSPGDPLRLTPRVAAHLPVPGAAGVRVIDLLYRTDAQHHHYIFTAEYTLGVIGPQHRVRRAAAFSESKTEMEKIHTLKLAEAGLPLVQQYRSLMR